jgi:hypothetical protein
VKTGNISIIFSFIVYNLKITHYVVWIKNSKQFACYTTDVTVQNFLTNRDHFEITVNYKVIVQIEVYNFEIYIIVSLQGLENRRKS